MIDRLRAPVLVVGVGSELRCDDGAGRRVADELAARSIPGFEVRSVHQLTPELASAMARRRLVVVVDASVEVSEVTVSQPPDAAADMNGSASGPMSHHLDIAALLALTRLFPDPPAEVVTVAIPAHDLDLGTHLSPGCARAAVETLDRVIDLGHRALQGSP